MENNNSTSRKQSYRKTQPEYTPRATSGDDDDNIPEIDSQNIAPAEDDRPRRDGPGGE